MSEISKIEWCDRTWSPWEGCQKVGPGCDHCYAEGMNRWLRHGENWGPSAPRRTYGPAHWKKPLRWNERAQAAGHPLTEFPSVCDPFDNAAPAGVRAAFGRLILATPSLIWLLLTKRIGNAPAMLYEMFADGPPSNVWLGATVVNQAEADRDIPKLLTIPVSVRFLSLEPLLEPIDLESVAWPGLAGHRVDVLRGGYWNQAPYVVGAAAAALGTPKGGFTNHSDFPSTIDWVITGGESGRGARIAHPAWTRALRDQCEGAGVPFMFKQWGQWMPGVQTTNAQFDAARAGVWVKRSGHIHDGTNPTAFGEGDAHMLSVGKKISGRLLDGVTHHAFPLLCQPTACVPTSTSKPASGAPSSSCSTIQ
ncbi:phage Gp37/Gp68 family protein [Burkholderia contaminans]|uniref:Phage Gp37/Gp68 family protein n=1 Tax=Burkholderia contaminans TaxID=488447 RepID=A0A3N8QEM6_9BURK|nr:phage Gp37/Gp68 family protein [Burkholderia contaminans]RQT22081.1 phage Gp37/Gp68 family protein [Burkholderia contaminans]